MTVPPGARTWFVVHFVVDVVFAIPLLAAPEAFLGALGWPCVDPVAARLAGAALTAIGVQSWIGRNEGTEAFRAMLNLKMIWSATSAIGVVVSQLSGGPAVGWLLAAVFAAFHVVWLRYRLLLRIPAEPRR